MSSSQSVGSALATAAGTSSRDEDWAVVQRVKAGRVGEFDRLVSKYRERVYSVMYNMTGNREDAADLAQEAFIKAFRSISRFRGRSSFYTWIYRIAVNGALTFLKKRSRRRYLSFETLDEELSQQELFRTLAANTGTEKGALLSELQEKLNDSMQQLSPKHRTVVVLHEIEGLDHRSIAEITRTSVGTVRSRLHYAKKQLQAHLNDYLK